MLPPDAGEILSSQKWSSSSEGAGSFLETLKEQQLDEESKTIQYLPDDQCKPWKHLAEIEGNFDAESVVKRRIDAPASSGVGNAGAANAAANAANAAANVAHHGGILLHKLRIRPLAGVERGTDANGTAVYRETLNVKPNATKQALNIPFDGEEYADSTLGAVKVGTLVGHWRRSR